MQDIAATNVLMYVGWSVYVLVTLVNCAKTAEPIEMLFGDRLKEPCIRYGCIWVLDHM